MTIFFYSSNHSYSKVVTTKKIYIVNYKVTNKYVFWIKKRLINQGIVIELDVY